MANSLLFTTADIRGYAEAGITDKIDGAVDWVQKKTDQAVREIIRLIPSVPVRIAAGTLDPEFVKDKVADAVLRVVRGPEGYTSENEGEYGYRANPRVRSGDIWFPPEDLEQLGLVDPAHQVPKTVLVKPKNGLPGYTRKDLRDHWVWVGGQWVEGFNIQ